MQAPSAKRLAATFDLSTKEAKLVRALAKAVDDGGLQNLIDANSRWDDKNALLSNTDRYVRSLYSSAWDSDIWRVTIALHGIDEIIGGYGVEGLGPERRGDYAPAFEYINMGDTYAATLIFDRDENKLFIGDWGTIAEELDREDEDEDFWDEL